MPHVSARHLDKKALQKIQKQLVRTLLRLDSQFRAQFFVSELLTETEQLMLAKRLVLIYLLKKECSYTRIQKILGVTPATIDRFQKRLNCGDFNTLTAHIKIERKTLKSQKSFWKELEELLDTPVLQNSYVTMRRL